MLTLKKERNFPNGDCEFDDEGPNGCWWRHSSDSSNTKLTTQRTTNECNVCETTFTNKYDMMMHKKNNHEESVPLCRNMRNGKCDFSNCWYRHKELQTKRASTNERKIQDVVFPVSQSKRKPPEINDLKDLLLKAMEMIQTVNKKIKTMQN